MGYVILLWDSLSLPYNYLACSIRDSISLKFKLTRTVRGSDYSPAIALSEDKDIFSNCDATLQKMIIYIPNVDLVNDKVYTKFGFN